MSRIQFVHKYEDIISLENLLLAWRDFTKGKKGRKDVQQFETRLMENLILLHRDLALGTYRHAGYQEFRISDPKPRIIHKATVRDRVLHRALYRKLYPFFDRIFVADSYSCRKNKGTHLAIRQFEKYARKETKNYIQACWILKCDIRKFFANIDQYILLGIISMYIPDRKVMQLLAKIIGSFNSGTSHRGLPLGNLTSQLLVNIYMNEFDQYVKHILRVKYYIRYADDFVFMSPRKTRLLEILSQVHFFLSTVLALELHPHKVSLTTLASGVDFLGWVHFPKHGVLRNATVRRMKKRLIIHPTLETIQLYHGLLGHGNATQLQAMLLDEYERVSQDIY